MSEGGEAASTVSNESLNGGWEVLAEVLVPGRRDMDG